ncbi:glycine zipper 2TM domain-containing protein [Paraburkholderia sp. BL10I2N1]|uniref:glycine zipper 2TM domain-containing protein n=1 Tax=Paraburkholderia sp. BL10I2N1 TaxID=1938796 RepID=UPI00105C59A3|nr:glycine zipper 2TM domain-containing protein [Paraburkholderia sp. BL10I2N1]TDN70199.1 outer membrane lipoprotein SlyB [Paraburkholderia sp. BL10I2N1]
MNGMTLSGVVASVIVLTACAPPPPAAPLPPGVSQAPVGSVFYGRVESIEPVTQQTGSSGVLGTVIGGVAGGVLGNQIGGGTGRTIATIGGAVAGGVAGNQLERRANSGTETIYRVNVRLDDGRLATVTQRDLGNLRVGDRAQVANDMAMPY